MDNTPVTEYTRTALNKVLSIDHIVMIHYYEHMSDFHHTSAFNNFWGILCVDEGEVEVLTSKSTYIIRSGNLIFHKPNALHNVQINGPVASNFVTIAFESDSECINFFEDKIIKINELERNLMTQIIIEARQGFSSPLNDPYLRSMTKATDPPFACEQLIKMYLEQILISLIRKETLLFNVQLPIKSIKQKSNIELFNRIVDYLQAHIYCKLSIEQICKDNLIGRSHLQRLFTNQANCGIIEYFSMLKIEQAKQLILRQQLNFSQIADSLGYTSIHYFSRRFKKITGMTPSEYAYSIKDLSER